MDRMEIIAKSIIRILYFFSIWILFTSALTSLYPNADDSLELVLDFAGMCLAWGLSGKLQATD
jgi:hypothetical protein